MKIDRYCDNKHNELVDVDPRVIGDSILEYLERAHNRKWFHYLQKIEGDEHWQTDMHLGH